VSSLLKLRLPKKFPDTGEHLQHLGLNSTGSKHTRQSLICHGVRVLYLNFLSLSDSTTNTFPDKTLQEVWEAGKNESMFNVCSVSHSAHVSFVHLLCAAHTRNFSRAPLTLKHSQ
jgi:hypothetical protein